MRDTISQRIQFNIRNVNILRLYGVVVIFELIVLQSFVIPIYQNGISFEGQCLNEMIF